MLYAQGCSSVVRHAAEVISDVNTMAQAVRQMSTLSAQSIESLWAGLTPRTGTPRTSMSSAGTALQAWTQIAGAPLDIASSQNLGRSVPGTAPHAGSPIAAGPFITALQRPSQPHPVLAPQSPASFSHMSGIADQSDTPTVAGSVIGSVTSERISFTDNMNSIVSSGILDAAISALREPQSTMPYTAASQAPPVSPPSEVNTQHAVQPTFERLPSNAGVLYPPCWMLKLPVFSLLQPSGSALWDESLSILILRMFVRSSGLPAVEALLAL
jgi:hypothetical protein